MKTKLKKIIAIATVGLLTCGCASNGANILSTEGEQVAVNPSPLKVIVPEDEHILRTNDKAIVGDLVLRNYSLEFMPGAVYGRVFVENKSPTNFVVHSRIDNGVAGSGVKYTVDYTLTPLGKGYEVTFVPKTRSTYQQGLIGKFPAPPFNDNSLRSYLKEFTLRYKFEIDTQYGSDSIMANFIRTGKVRNSSAGWKDPITNKIYTQYFILDYAGKQANYTVEVYPYRNGSKAVINMELPVVETSPSVVDFTRIIGDLRKQLTSIVQS